MLQTTYLRVLEGRARFGGRSSLKTWLFGVIRKVADERRRRERWRRVLLLRWWEGRPRSHEDGPEEGALGVERAARIRAALAALSPRQREVLELVFYQDVSVRDAGAILGISEGSAITHYARGKRELARRLDAERLR
ncbi:MAG: RNA polymerase sigma factor [Planctomycetes bacterium]|nr:RNA polymerase sigma factor [Planctomycetota bacterium]